MVGSELKILTKRSTDHKIKKSLKNAEIALILNAQVNIQSAGVKAG